MRELPDSRPRLKNTVSYMVLNLMSSMTIIRLSGSFIGILLMVLMGIMVQGLGTSFLYGMADGKR